MKTESEQIIEALKDVVEDGTHVVTVSDIVHGDIFNLEKQEENKPERNEKGQLLPGSTANPNGRPKGKTMKEYAREYYMSKSDEDKKAYIEWLDEKKPGFAWTMGEGNPSNDSKVDVTTKGEKISSLPQEAIAIIEEDLKKRKTDEL